MVSAVWLGGNTIPVLMEFSLSLPPAEISPLYTSSFSFPADDSASVTQMCIIVTQTYLTLHCHAENEMEPET